MIKEVLVLVDNKSVGIYLLNVEILSKKQENDLIPDDVIQIISERKTVINTKKYYLDKFVKIKDEYELYLYTK